MADTVVSPSEFAAVPHVMIKQFEHHEIKMLKIFWAATTNCVSI